MTTRKTWLITGAGRGMGVEFAKAALAAGHAVVATGRDSARVSRALGRVDRSTGGHARRNEPHDAEGGGAGGGREVRRIDVLVNNAASFYAGYFEELTPE